MESKSRRVSVVTLSAEGRQLARGAVLILSRDYPEPDLPGLMSWSVAGSTDEFGPLPEDTTLALTLTDGRTVQGHAFLKNHSLASGRASSFQYQGTGPVDGLTERDYP